MTASDGPIEPPEEVQELTGIESGRWRVFTQGSSHLFDFEAGTVTRIPGPTAWPGANDQPRPIRSIERCKVGERGYWTMKTDGWSPSVDYWWHSSSVIRKITREAQSSTKLAVAQHRATVTKDEEEDWPPPGQSSTAGLADDGEDIPDLVSSLHETLGVQLVGDLGGATDDDDVESWEKGLRIPRGDGMARLYLTGQIVSALEKRGVSPERIAMWFATQNHSMSDLTPAELILEMDPGLAEQILWEAARRFAILGR